MCRQGPFRQKRTFTILELLPVCDPQETLLEHILSKYLLLYFYEIRLINIKNGRLMLDDATP